MSQYHNRHNITTVTISQFSKNIIWCIVYIICCIVYIICCTLYIIWCILYSIWCIPFVTLWMISCCFSVSKILFRHLYLGSERIFSIFHVEPALLVILWNSPKRGTSYDVYHTSYEVHYTSYDVYPCRCIHHMRYTIHHMMYTYIDVYLIWGIPTLIWGIIWGYESVFVVLRVCVCVGVVFVYCVHHMASGHFPCRVFL